MPRFAFVLGLRCCVADSIFQSFSFRPHNKHNTTNSNRTQQDAMQSIVYAAVITDGNILVKQSTVGDVDSQVLSKASTFKTSPNGSYPGGFISSKSVSPLLSSLPRLSSFPRLTTFPCSQNDSKYKVSLLIDSGTTYACAALPAFSNKVIGLFLAEVRTEWKSGSKRGVAMEEYLRGQMVCGSPSCALSDSPFARFAVVMLIVPSFFLLARSPLSLSFCCCCHKRATLASWTIHLISSLKCRSSSIK